MLLHIKGGMAQIVPLFAGGKKIYKEMEKSKNFEKWIFFTLRF